MGFLSSKLITIFISLIILSGAAFAVAPTINLLDKQVDADLSFVSGLLDLWEAASDEDQDSLLRFSITNQSNTSLINCFIDDGHIIDCDIIDPGREGESIISVQVTDTEGLTDSDSFMIFVSDGTPSPSICNDIEVRTHLVRVEEDSSEEIVFIINNLSSRDFEINDVKIDESSPHISFGEPDFENFLDGEDSVELVFEAEAFSVSSQKDITASIRVKGEFDNRTDCDFGDIVENFRVIVEEDDEDDFSSSICSEIEIDNSRIELKEDDFETVEVTVSNESGRTFDVSFVSVSENSPDLKVSVSRRPSEIKRGESEVIALRFETDKVSRDETGKITLSISGEFSSGQNCASTQIRKQISFEIENDEDDSGDESDELEISFSPQDVQLFPGESKFVVAKIENNENKRICPQLNFFSANSSISGSVEVGSFCISAKNEKTVEVRVSASSNAVAGNYSARLGAEFGSKTSTKTISVKVIGTTTQPAEGGLEIINAPLSVTVTENDLEFVSITISNTGNAAITNLALSMENLPTGVFFQPYFRQKLEKGEIITVTPRIETKNAPPAEVDAVLTVSSDSKTARRPVRISVEKVTGTAGPTPNDGSISGLAPLAGTIGVGIALLAVLAAIVIVVVLLVKK
ncbi:MAG: hypothetical protein HYW50_04245 [Candidatus Diapherotrites archaeon]|nr:hypothetical protein [Candidatus Diapherotrites archaeon]